MSYEPAAFLEDAEWLAETRETWHQAARRLGVSPTALEKRLRAHGRPGLAQRFSGYADWNAQRRDTHPREGAA